MGKNHLDRAVYVYNKTRETFVATEATVADSYLRRLVGLLGKTKRWARHGCGLWIVPSRGVHTIGMMFPIDLIFLSKEKEVVHIEEFVRPFRISSVSLCIVTFSPRSLSSRPRLDAVSPLPRLDATPPVTKRCLVEAGRVRCGDAAKVGLPWSSIGR